MQDIPEAIVDNVKEFLSRLSKAELYSLASTVTRNLLRSKINTTEEAIELIILHSPDPISVLRRKTVTRDILFNYLTSKNVSLINPTKDILIDKVLSYWESLPTSHRAIEPNNAVVTSHRAIEPNNDTVAPPEIEYSAESNNVTEATNEILQYLSENHNRAISSQFSINEMALQFSEWFYKMFNEDKPIGVEHFWKDCALKINMYSQQNVSNEECSDSCNVVKALYKIKCEHQMYLNPNLLKEGVQGRMNPHGLVLILTCGTVHVNNACVGIFEQVFALARDPSSENNWKVKNTELNLRSQSAIKPPELTDSELTNNLLQLPQL